MASDAQPKVMSQAEFAKRRGVSRKAVTSWKQKGLLSLTDDGLVEVEASEWALDQRPAVNRGGVTHRPVRKVAGNRQGVTARPKVTEAPQVTESGEPSEDDGKALDLDDPNLTHAEAARRKENYLGLIRRREFEISNREWVRVDDVIREVEREYGTVRERLLVIPGKLAALLVGLDRAEIEAALRGEITEALNELHDPGADSSAAELYGKAEPGAASA